MEHPMTQIGTHIVSWLPSPDATTTGSAASAAASSVLYPDVGQRRQQARFHAVPQRRVERAAARRTSRTAAAARAVPILMLSDSRRGVPNRRMGRARPSGHLPGLTERRAGS